jgi:crotonobetainyl-CoA:carnitine CoA-transferase CaiB-like acyl-CoA transferase
MSGWLSSYRVLDLTDERGLLAGQIFAKLGADVIQIEPPGGSSARHKAPLDDRGRSYYWSAYAAGKRSITLDLEQDQDRDRLLQLVDSADFLFESAAPGKMAELGLDYATLSRRNPKLIHVSITPFGADGPKRGYADSDIVLWAAGGPMHPHRDGGFLDGEGPPLRISVPQSYLHAAADAAGGALIAHFERVKSGLGQHVEISAQESVTITGLANLAAAAGDMSFDYVPPSRRKPGQTVLDLSGSGSRTRRNKWKVKDGLVEMHLGIGPALGAKTNNLFAWIKQAGRLPEKFHDWNWIKLPDRLLSKEVTDEDMEEAREVVRVFLEPWEKDALFAEAVKLELGIAPVQTVGDLLVSRQHRERNFFVTVNEQGEERVLPGNFALGAQGMFDAPKPAPGLGEHNKEILGALAARAPATAQPVAREASPRRYRPLEGLKVLELAWVVAGPYIGRSLADYGATVIRVESSLRLDTCRGMGPFPGAKMDFQRSALFDTCNANKVGLTIDLTKPEAREVIRDLAKDWADVLIESFTPGQMSRWGLAPDTLRAANPRLIGMSTSLMGQTGPYKTFSGFGNMGAAVAGYQAIAGHEGRLPIGPYGPYTDYTGPRYGIIAILTAIDHFRRTGESCWLDVSQAESGIQFLGAEIARGAATAVYPTSMGNRDLEYAPNGAFPGKEFDSWIAVTVRSDAEWASLAALIGGEATSPAFTTFAGRKAREDEVEALVAAWTRQYDALKVEEMLQKAGIPAHNVASSLDLTKDPQLTGRRHFVRLPHPLGGESVFEASRYTLSATPAEYRRPAPHYCRDNDEVLAQLLGYAPERIESLKKANIFK